MKIRIHKNRYLQFFAESGEHITVEQSEDDLQPTVSLDLQDVIGIEGVQGPQGVAGERGQSAKETLIGMGLLQAAATDNDFLNAIRGDRGVGITGVEVLSTQNIKLNRVNCDTNGVCNIEENATGARNGVKTELTLHFSDNSTEVLDIISESGANGTDYVSMSSTDYQTFFGSMVFDETSGIQSYTSNNTTIYLVPKALFDNLQQ